MNATHGFVIQRILLIELDHTVQQNNPVYGVCMYPTLQSTKLYLKSNNQFPIIYSPCKYATMD